VDLTSAVDNDIVGATTLCTLFATVDAKSRLLPKLFEMAFWKTGGIMLNSHAKREFK
jgi:hypothetical protein